MQNGLIESGPTDWEPGSWKYDVILRSANGDLDIVDPMVDIEW